MEKSQKDGTAFPGALPADAEHRRPLCLHRAGRRALWFLHRPQGNPKGTGGRKPAGSGNRHALRRVQTLRGGVHRRPDFYQDRARRHRQGLVLRYESRWLFP